MEKYNWSQLHRMRLGRYAEYFAKMEFTQFNFDVYTSEVDNRGIDFVIRKDKATYYDVQVKSARPENNKLTPFILIEKKDFTLQDNLLIVVVLFFNGKPPQYFLIPISEWGKPNNNKLLKLHPFGGPNKSPAWAVILSKKGLALLEQQYKFDIIVQQL